MARRLINSGIVVTLDGAVPVLRRGDVLIEGTRIALVAAETPIGRSPNIFTPCMRASRRASRLRTSSSPISSLP